MNNQERIVMGGNLAGVVLALIFAFCAIGSEPPSTLAAALLVGIACACFANVVGIFVGHLIGWQ